RLLACGAPRCLLRSLQVSAVAAERPHPSSHSIRAQPSRQMKIYTRTGDRGTSALFTGERRPKTDPIFDALGCLDELSAQIGVAIADWRGLEDAADEQLRRELLDRLIRVQCLLQECMSCVATPRGSPAARQFHLDRSDFPTELAKELEAWIDEYTSELPPLRQFILPSGSSVGARLHVARAVCRRAERSLACLLDTSGGASGGTSGSTSGSTSGGASGSTSGSTSGGASGSTSGGASGSTSGGASGSTSGSTSGGSSGGTSGVASGHLEPSVYAYVN
ncbi:hypothetical protein BOX15_Mlig000554g2, partial [Macrostomum lignano]